MRARGTSLRTREERENTIKKRWGIYEKYGTIPVADQAMTRIQRTDDKVQLTAVVVQVQDAIPNL